jgi:hypothetical protein
MAEAEARTHMRPGLLIPGLQFQPQHIYYYCYLITPATTIRTITTAINYNYLIAVDATSTAGLGQ